MTILSILSICPILMTLVLDKMDKMDSLDTSKILSGFRYADGAMLGLSRGNPGASFRRNGMEKCLDLALRTAGAAGSVAPTRHGLRLERFFVFSRSISVVMSGLSRGNPRPLP